jgi:chromosome segregation ATPase
MSDSGEPSLREVLGAIQANGEIVQGVAKEVRTLAGNVSSLTGDVGSLRGDVSSLTGDVGSLRGDVGSLTGDVESLAGNFGALAGNFGSLAGDVGSLAGNFGLLAGEVGSLAGDVAALKESVRVLGERLDIQSRKHDDLRVAVMARIDRLQDAMSEKRDDVTVLLDLLVTNQHIAERSIAEARLALDGYSRTSITLTAFERQIRRLQDEVRELRDRP